MNDVDSLELMTLARSFAQKFVRGLSHDLEEDIRQECYIAIHRALESFQPRKGASLRSWLYFHVQDQLGRFRRAETDGMRPFQPLDRPSLISMEKLPALHTNHNSMDLMISCRQILTKKELAMLINDSGINGQPETIKSMAISLGITRAMAARHLNSAREKMQESIK